LLRKTKTKNLYPVNLQIKFFGAILQLPSAGEPSHLEGEQVPYGARRASQQPLFLIGGTFWTKSELFLTKTRTLNFDCRASRGRAENFSARAGREEKGVWVK